VFVLDRVSPLLLVLHPDQLVAGTRVGDALGCLRAAMIGEKLKVPGTACSINMRFF
jgi:hypothetical protein